MQTSRISGTYRDLEYCSVSMKLLLMLLLTYSKKLNRKQMNSNIELTLMFLLSKACNGPQTEAKQWVSLVALHGGKTSKV